MDVEDTNLWSVDTDDGDSELTGHDLRCEIPVSYPSEYWLEHPGKIPIVLYDATAERLHVDIAVMMAGRDWNDILVTSFMVAVMRENIADYTQIAVPEWTADGIEIGALNAEVTPLSILNIVPAVPPLPAVVGDAPRTSREVRLSFFYGFLTVYRRSITRNSNEAYGLETARRMFEFFQTNGLTFNPNDQTAFTVYCGEDRLTPNYKKLIAAIDMFFFRFPQAKMAVLRMATLLSRYRGCGALVSMGQIGDLTGMKVKDLAMYVYTRPVASNVRRILKKGQGMGDPFGHFPYQLDFKMTARSAYSMTANPTLYYWLHIIGCMLGSPRSINARMPKALDVINTFDTASAVALGLGGNLSVRRQFTQAEDAVRRLRNRIAALAAIQGRQPLAIAAPAGIPGAAADAVAVAAAPVDPERAQLGDLVKCLDILADYIQQGGVTAAMRLEIRDRANKCRNALPGTVGHDFFEMKPPPTAVIPVVRR